MSTTTPASFGGSLKLTPGAIVLATDEDTGPDASGNYVLGRHVTFQFSNGDVGTAWFPYPQLTVPNVVAAADKIWNAIAEVYGTSNP